MTKHKGPFCGGKLHKRDGTCTQPPGWGTDHPGTGRCKLHGGNSPASRRKAVTEAARDAVIQLGFEPVSDPLTVLAAVTGELVAVKDFLRGQVERLTSIRTTTAEGAEQLRAELTAYQQSLRDTVGALGVMAKLNIDERLARVTERQMDMLSGAMSAVLAEMGIGPADVREVRARVARHLRAV